MGFKVINFKMLWRNYNVKDLAISNKPTKVISLKWIYYNVLSIQQLLCGSFCWEGDIYFDSEEGRPGNIGLYCSYSGGWDKKFADSRLPSLQS